MQEVFRFVFLRPPQRPASPQFTGLTLATTSFGRRLAGLWTREDGREQVLQAVSDFFDSPGFSRNISAAPLGPQFQAFGVEFSQMRPVTLNRVRAAIEEQFGRPASAVVGSEEFASLRVRVTDAIVALKIMPRVLPTGAGDYVRLFELMDVVERAARGSEILEQSSANQLLRRPITVPPELLPRQSATTLKVEPEPSAGNRDEQRRTLRRQLREIEAAKAEVLSFGSADVSVLRASDDPTDDASRQRLVVLNARAVGRLSSRTREVLESLSADASREPVRRVVERLSVSARRAALELSALETETTSAVPARLRVGTTTLPALPALNLDLVLVAEETPKVPTTVGLVQPSGVGDLEVTRQQIKRYEAGEIAHIENVMRSESRSRETRRLERVEQTFRTELETTRVEERDLQSTDRFEIQREIQNTLKEDDKFKRGATISGGYGKFIQAEVNVESETQTSQEQASKTASKFARDITERTASKLTERIREERSLTILREFEEKNKHGFENTNGTDHAIGIYQWIDRIYQAQVFNYGIRLFFDIMVPEPAAFYLQALAAQLAPGEGVARPDPFNLGPEDINQSNYRELVAKYRTSGVEAPPPEYVTVSKTVKQPPEPGAENSLTLLIDGDIDIPPNYKATEIHFRMSWHKKFALPAVTPDPSPEAVIHLGQHQIRLDLTLAADEFQPNAFFNTYTLDDETGTLPYGFHFFAAQLVLVVMEVVCKRTEDAYDAWRLRTFEAIAQSYMQQEEAYRNRVAELQVQAGVSLPERAPFESRTLERTELKRNAISIVTGQYFTRFSAILASGVQEARVDFDEALAEGQYARFFEQAFEWEHMEYEFLDYFWARRSTWVQKLLTEDADPEFAAFLRAGYARLRIPVRPDFEVGVFHFLDTGTVWDGGELPPVTRPEYAVYLADIEARRALEPDAEIPVGEPFDVRLPTTLVRLKPSATLPFWEQNEDGEWVPGVTD